MMPNDNPIFLRKQMLDETVKDSIFDVVVIGAGINGACIYHQLCEAGYRVLLLDKGDFAGGTSQSSAMMIWGGLLYLSTLDLATVIQLSICRERMIRQLKESVTSSSFRYLSSCETGRAASFMMIALHLYWLLGGFQRKRPRIEKSYPEFCFLKEGAFRDCLTYEEACLKNSDARFVLKWILDPIAEDQVPLNYCGVTSARYDRAKSYWILDFKDTLLNRECTARTRLVVNAAGIWADSLNETAGVDTPYRHIFGKGVFIAIPRETEHNLPLIIDGGPYSECLSLIPWGPVALWGPTETRVSEPEEGFETSPEDVRFLLEQINRHVRRTVTAEQIISLRCGVRPLVVPKNFTNTTHTLNISRHHRIHADNERRWITVYGGKITNCIPLSQKTLKLIGHLHKPSGSRTEKSVSTNDIAHEMFPGISEPVPSASWCASREFCWSLEDYLRRRTNISQWIKRGGFGADNENTDQLRGLAAIFARKDPNRSQTDFESYQSRIKREFDEVLAKC
jgi:glycerol-3-phosphate dehydrogenase